MKKSFLIIVILCLPLSACNQAKEEEKIDFNMQYLANGKITVGINLKGGGQISHLSLNNEANMIDNYDYGREIQFTLRDETSTGPGYEQWWNPTQGGHAFKGSGVSYFSNANGQLHTVTQPFHFLELWFDDNRSNVLMDQTISFYNENVIYVELEVDYFDTETRFGCHEWPASYLKTNYTNLIFYEGSNPFNNGQITTISVVSSKDRPSHTNKPTENWASLVDNQGNGVTLYSKENIDFITYMYVSGENSTSHIAFKKCVELVPGETQYFSYYLIPGNWEEARKIIYQIEGV